MTLVYADPPGIPLSDVHTVNDLNLKVTSPSELVYWGNCGLFESNWSSSECDGPNPPNPHHPSDPEAPVLDVVENVFLQAPEPGRWTIEVIAENITEDAHVLYLNDDPTECCNKSQEDCVEPSPTDADFALVASGVLGSCCYGRWGACINTTCSYCEELSGDFRRNHTCETRICPSQN